MAAVVFPLLAVLGGAAYYLGNYEPEDLDPGEKRVPQVVQTPLVKDFFSSGIVTGVIRPFYLTMADLNEAFKPYSAPNQDTTFDVGAVFSNFAENIGYEESNAPAFFFKPQMAQISLSTNEQSNLNLLQLTEWSPPKGSDELAYYPRAYYEYRNQDLFNQVHGSRWTTFGTNTDAGMPTETEVVHSPPDAGSITAEYNPWGPGGKLQNLFANGMAARTQQKGTNLSTIVGPPLRSKYVSNPFSK